MCPLFQLISKLSYHQRSSHRRILYLYCLLYLSICCLGIEWSWLVWCLLQDIFNQKINKRSKGLYQKRLAIEIWAVLLVSYIFLYFGSNFWNVCEWGGHYFHLSSKWNYFDSSLLIHCAKEEVRFVNFRRIPCTSNQTQIFLSF